MHLLEIDRSVAMFFRILLIASVGNLFIPQISAKYFIEITDQSERTVKISLYECARAPKEALDSGILPTTTSNTLGVSKTSELPTVDDVMCKEVPEGPKKRWIYKTANFYHVSNVGLDGGKRLFNTKRNMSGSLLSKETASTSVGVRLFGEAECDFPEISDGSDDKSTLSILREKSKAALVAANVLDDKNLEDFAVYLGKDNFNAFIHPTQKLVDQVKLFGDVTNRVRNLYDSTFKSKVDQETKRKVREQVAGAVTLLSQKVVDPCLVFGRFGSSKDGDTQCNKICRFLAIGFDVFKVASYAGSRGSIVSGTCNKDQRCWCKKEREISRWEIAEHNVRMIELSNELRAGIAEKTTKSGVGASPSVRQG